MVDLKDILIASGDEETFFYLSKVFTRLLSAEDKIKVETLKRQGANLEEIKEEINH